LCYTHCTVMKSTFTSFFVAFSLAFAPAIASAATLTPVPNRYFVQTTKSFWRNALGARNTFDGGFTADLSDLQLRLAKIAGLKPIAVKKFTILETQTSPTPTPQPTPTTSAAWGVKYILGSQELGTVGGKGITIALLDTGADVQHPDLKGRVVGCTNYTNATEAFVDEQCDDENGHGTHMAGVAVADGGERGKGIRGLAPQADLLVSKVCNADGICLSDDIAKAIIAAVDNGANIIMLGLGGESDSSFIADAITYAAEHDVLVVTAAGNDGPDNEDLDWPARNPQTVSVGAIGADSRVAEFSSRGINGKTKAYFQNAGDIEFVAPGVNIESTFKGGDYAILSGTSMAVPHIAGLAARVWQADAEHPAAATRMILHQMALDLSPSGDDHASGWGVPIY
jgi:subtilisin